MKSAVTCSVDSEILKEAREKGLVISHVLENALSIETSLTNGLEKNKLQELIEKNKNKIMQLETKLEQLKTKEERIRELRELPTVKEAIEVLSREPQFFEGRLRLLRNSGVDITAEQLKQMIKSKE